MGINTNAYLSSSIELEELVEVIRNLTDADEVTLRNGYSTERRGIIKMTRGAEFVDGQDYWNLDIARDEGFGDFDGEDPIRGHNGMVSYGPEGIRVHGGNASAFWVALGKALVDFYGGVVDYNDCDSIERDYSKGRTARARSNDDDSGYTRQRNAIKRLKPVDLAWTDSVEGIYDRYGNYHRTTEELRHEREYARRVGAR